MNHHRKKNTVDREVQTRDIYTQGSATTTTKYQNGNTKDKAIREK